MIRAGTIRRQGNKALRVLVVLFVLYMPESVDAQANTTQLAGRLTAADGSPVAGAEVMVAGSVLAYRSDSAGRFLVEGVPMGELRIRVRALGFAPLDTLIVLPERSSSVTLTMGRSVQQLAPVVTEAVLPYGKPLRYQHTSKFDDFYERRAKRPGTFFTREDIELSGRNTAMELISTAPGVRLNWRSDGTAVVRVARCTATSIYGAPRDRGDTDHGWLSVFIDGQRIGRGGQGQIETLAQLKANEIETMEVYRGPSQLPLEAIGDACAAVFITTRYTTGSVLPKK